MEQMIPRFSIKRTAMLLLVFLATLALSMAVTGCGRRNMSASEATESLVAKYGNSKKSSSYQASIKDLSKAKVDRIPDQYYTGYEIEPAFTVRLDGRKVPEYSYSNSYSSTLKTYNFTFSYSKNRRPGVAKVDIKGLYNYTGNLQGTFNIVDPAGDFVRHLYEAALQRTPSEEEVENWAGPLRTIGLHNVKDVAWAIFGSPEMQERSLSRGEFVNAAYQAFFSRTPDSAEREHWVKQLKDGLSREELVRAFADSAEFSPVAGKILLQRGEVMDAQMEAAKKYSAKRGSSSSGSSGKGSSSASHYIPKEKRNLGNSPFSDPAEWGYDGIDIDDDDGWMFEDEARAEQAWLDGEEGWYNHLENEADREYARDTWGD